MSKLQIELYDGTGDALTSLADAQGTTPANLIGQIVSQYVSSQMPHHDHPQTEPDQLAAIINQHMGGRADSVGNRIHGRRRDPLDAIVGSIDADPADDIDEVIYGQ